MPKKRKTRNEFEKKLERQLRRSRVHFKYESERITYILAGYYLPDFVIDTVLGKIYIEAKGYFRPEHKRKMVAVKKQHPELDIRIVFYCPPTTKQGKKYEAWAIRHGFRYSFETIPKDWLLGL